MHSVTRRSEARHPGPLRIPALQLTGLPWLNKVVLSCLVLSRKTCMNAEKAHRELDLQECVARGQVAGP